MSYDDMEGFKTSIAFKVSVHSFTFSVLPPFSRLTRHFPVCYSEVTTALLCDLENAPVSLCSISAFIPSSAATSASVTRATATYQAMTSAEEQARAAFTLYFLPSEFSSEKATLP